MRINPKIYHVADEAKPIQKQQLEDGRVIEVFLMDEFEDVYNEFTGQSKFSVWSSEDGINYRLFVESGNYETLKELYCDDVNKVWLEFWDECDQISNGASRKIIMPITLLCVCLYLVGVSVWKWEMWICLLILVAFVGILMFLNRFTKKKIADVNLKSIDKIKAAIGDDCFKDLLEKQRNYPDEFYERKYPSEFDNDEENKESDESMDEIKEDNK